MSKTQHLLGERVVELQVRVRAAVLNVLLDRTGRTFMQIQKSVGRSTKVDWALTADRRHTAALAGVVTVC